MDVVYALKRQGAPSTGSAVKRPGPRRIYESTSLRVSPRLASLADQMEKALSGPQNIHLYIMIVSLRHCLSSLLSTDCRVERNYFILFYLFFFKVSEAPASQRRQPDFRAFDTVYSGVPRPIYRNATIERLKPNRNFYFGPRHRSRIRFESLKSREGQVKSCNNVDEKRSVGREALITVYPTVREVVDSGASRFAYLAFVRICIRRVPFVCENNNCTFTILVGCS
ncbi:hypothetical protein EVAR_91027_1 [Eumeta japonica]|uniref:Uncharacterized protein n=1 Tax=Eumeta variegata TaxID=151549 RepID=A0A4C1T3E6_EUMVA|nr:hypothetical protein EVAR_91027_1 [Eumeta japonica]